MNKIEILKHADEKLRSDFEFMLSMIEVDPIAYTFASDNLKLDRKFVAKSTSINMLVLRYVDPKMKANFEHLVYLDQNDAVFFHKNPSEFLDENVRRFLEGGFDWGELKQKKIKINDLALAESYVKKDGENIIHCRRNILSEELINLAINSCGNAIQYLKIGWGSDPSRFELKKSDYESLVLKAISCPMQKECRCFEDESQSPLVHVPYQLVRDKNFILKAIDTNPSSFHYAVRNLQIDADVLLSYKRSCLEHYGSFEGFSSIANSFKYFGDFKGPNSYLREKDNLIKLLKLSHEFFILIDANLKKSRDFLLDAVGVAPKVLELLSDEFKQDKEILLKAITADPSLMKHAPEEFKQDKEIFKQILDIKSFESNVCETDSLIYSPDVQAMFSGKGWQEVIRKRQEMIRKRNSEKSE